MLGKSNQILMPQKGGNLRDRCA